MTDPDKASAGTPQGDTSDTASARTDPRLLEFMVCPVTRATLSLSADRTELISRRARLAFPIRDGIPLLTTEAARELTDDELRKQSSPHSPSQRSNEGKA